MASQGPLSPGTAANDNSAGTTAWTNPGDIVSSNDVRANVATTVETQYLKATNFGFSIPTGATIDGIVVEVERSTQNQVGHTQKARIVKGGVIGTTDKADTSVTWPAQASEAYVTYGASNDLWGETWTAADINASDFGFALTYLRNTALGTAQVDHIRITVYYTESSGGSGFNIALI